MATADTNKTQGDAPTSQLISSDAPNAQAGQAADEPQYVVDGKSVTREAYMEALPKAGYVPDRMPANHFPPISTK